MPAPSVPYSGYHHIFKTNSDYDTLLFKTFNGWLLSALQINSKLLTWLSNPFVVWPVYLPSVFILYNYMNFELRFSLILFFCRWIFSWSLFYFKGIPQYLYTLFLYCFVCLFDEYFYFSVVFFVCVIETVSSNKPETQKSIWFIRIYVRKDQKCLFSPNFITCKNTFN